MTEKSTSGSERIHFVTDLRDELDRLGISRTDECIVCDEVVSDDEVGELRRAEPDYETVCNGCRDGVHGP